MIEGYIAEDIALATHADLPPLRTTLPPTGKLSNSFKKALEVGLEEQLLFNVRRAQDEGWLPCDDELATLPAFQEALQEDAHHIKCVEKELAARKEARRLAMERAQRAEAERQRLAAEHAAAEAKQKREAKEARRLARLSAKREVRERAHAEDMRRYEDLRSRWQTTVDERQSKLDEVETAIKAASDRKAAVQAKLSALSEDKAALLKKLRDLATNTSQQQQQQQQQIQPAKIEVAEPSSAMLRQGSSAGLATAGLSRGVTSPSTSAAAAVPSSGYYAPYNRTTDRDTWDDPGRDLRPSKRPKEYYGGPREYEPRKDYASMPYESSKPAGYTPSYAAPLNTNLNESNPAAGGYESRKEYYGTTYRGGKDDAGWRRGYDHEPAMPAARHGGPGGGKATIASPGRERGGGAEFGSYLRHEDKPHRGTSGRQTSPGAPTGPSMQQQRPYMNKMAGGGGSGGPGGGGWAGGGGGDWNDRGEDYGSGAGAGRYSSGRRSGYDAEMHPHHGPAGAAGIAGPPPSSNKPGGFNNRPLTFEERESVRQKQGNMHPGEHQEQRREGYGGGGGGGGGRGWGYQGR